MCAAICGTSLAVAVREIRQLGSPLPRNTVLCLVGSGASRWLPVKGARIVATWDDLDEGLRTLNRR